MKIVENRNYGCETLTSGDLARFAKTHKLADPILVPVRKGGLTGSGDAGQCHTNALLLAYRYGGKVLTGYSADVGWGGRDSQFEPLWGHSVWVTPEGNAVCPTLQSVFPDIGDIPFIPCVEHDEGNVRNFFQDGAHPIVFKSIVYGSDDGSYAVQMPGLARVVQQLDRLNTASKTDRKRMIKDLQKAGLGGSKKYPLRRSLFSKSVFKSSVSLDWLLDDCEIDFLQKVFPNGIR